ncbi:hypothetical protein [Herbiconiux daphne]|uniref:Uncharacterized protein n=1 Tax=Herbiconiux daphne TaxID=2970914 RepID=A0ABT2H914_9MICO|nr:hypothetical protein [Herbiconiux daphne]MCS5736450.1 hypothetical protein [Herbiconiux daphne]
MTIYNKKIREKQVLKNKLLKLCQSKYKEMTAAEKLVSELIFKNNVDIFNDSINVFACKCTVTVSTINR